MKTGRFFTDWLLASLFWKLVLLQSPYTFNAQGNRSCSCCNMTPGIAKAGSGNNARSHSCTRIACNNLTRCESKPHKYNLLNLNSVALQLNFPLAESQTTPGLCNTTLRKGKCKRGWVGEKKRQRSYLMLSSFTKAYYHVNALFGSQMGPWNRGGHTRAMECHWLQDKSALPHRNESWMSLFTVHWHLQHWCTGVLVGKCRLICAPTSI